MLLLTEVGYPVVSGNSITTICLHFGSAACCLDPPTLKNGRSNDERVCAGLLLLAPTWLAYTLCTDRFFGPGGYTALLAAALMLLATGMYARWFKTHFAQPYHSWKRSGPRLFDQSLSWIDACGIRISMTIMWTVLILTGALHLLKYGVAFSTADFLLVMALYTGLGLAWFEQSRRDDRLLSSYLAQACGVGLLALIRKQLLLTTDFWNYEYDVWVVIAVSFCIAGLKQQFEQPSHKRRASIITTLIVLPVFACSWVLIQYKEV